MNYAVILSGGIGTRMRSDGFPKQYLEVCEKPVLIYTLEKFQNCEAVDAIIVVANTEWQEQIRSWASQYGITKLKAFGDAGKTRQHSVLNGLAACEQFGITEQDVVAIHDAARPLISPQLIASCIEALRGQDAVLPVLPMKDAIYCSEDGEQVDSFADRSKLFCGQSPEVFWLKEHLEMNRNTSDEELGVIRGSSELAYKKGLRIFMIPGEETNFKLTTPDDLLRLSFYINSYAENDK